MDKVTSGRYGACETCGAPIADERLLARPDARFCERHERDWEFGRLAFQAPPLTRPPDDAREPGWRELTTLPDEEEPAEPKPELGNEERALHDETTGQWLDPDVIEAVEAAADADAADGFLAAIAAERTSEFEIEDVVGEEERLGQSPGAGLQKPSLRARARRAPASAGLEAGTRSRG